MPIDITEHLNALEQALSQTPWPLPCPGVEFFRDLHIQVRVSAERRKTEEDREQGWQAPRRASSLPRTNKSGAAARIAIRRMNPGSRSRSAPSRRCPGGTRSAPARSARQRYPWAVLLGDPGTGKTTLLRYEGWLTARDQLKALKKGGIDEVVLPLYLRLADLAKAVAEAGDMVEILASLVTNPLRGVLAMPSALGPILRQKLRSGQVVLLLDALDEVPGKHYDALVQWLVSWVQTHRPQRLYLTSRLAGYRGLPADFIKGDRSGSTELELVAFTSTEIRQYITAYFGEMTDPSTGLRLADDLWHQLEQNPALLGLAQTPLLLTLICLAFAQTGQGRKLWLPATRCELYAECLEGLLGRWPLVRETQWERNLYPDEIRQVRLKRDLLAQLAWQLCGTEPDVTLFTQFEIEEALEAQPCQTLLQRLVDWKSEEVLTNLTQGCGILIQTGTGPDAQYLFLHRSFQEYLLAWALARRPDWLSSAREVIRSHLDGGAKPVGRRLGPTVVEEHRRCGQQSEEYVSRLLLENANDLLCRPLLLAGLAAGEACRCLSEELARRLTEKLADLYFRGPCFSDKDSLIASLTALSRHALKPLVAALKDEDRDVRDSAAAALGRLGQAGPEAVAALVAALKDEYWDVRDSAAAALGRLGQAGPEEVAALVAALKDEDPGVRRLAAEASGRLGQAGPEVVAALVAALKDKDRDVRRRAAAALGRLGQARAEGGGGPGRGSQG